MQAILRISRTVSYTHLGDSYREAVYADYFTASKFFIKGDVKYTGWQTLDGKLYFFTADGNKVTRDPSLAVGSGTIDVYKRQILPRRQQ